MSNHMSAMVNSTIYTIGGTAVYWTPNSTASSIVSSNNNSVNILRTGNSFLRALDLSKAVDFGAEFSDTTEVISELPFTIPLSKRGAAWADQNTIYYWGGELEGESLYMDGAFQNTTREWVDPTKYYTYDLNQPRGSGTWKTVSISETGGSDMLTSSPGHGEYTYAAGVRKGFYLGGVMARHALKNKDGSNATKSGDIVYDVSSMIVFDAATNVWKNETIIAELNGVQDGAIVYVAGVGEKGILVRMGGARKDGFIGFETVYVYDIATGIWYSQPTTSRTKVFPETRFGGFCAGAAAAPDNTSFTIYIYGGFDYKSFRKRTWALTMPYFQWLPVGSMGEPERGRADTMCHTIGGQLAMVRGRSNQKNRGDTNGGTYFYDMTNLTWSLKYQPSEYRVPKTIYDVIGGNGQGGATLTGPADDESFAGSLGKLFAAAANRTNSPNLGGGANRTNSLDPGGGANRTDSLDPDGGVSRTNPPDSAGRSSSSTGTIVGSAIGGFVVLAAIGVGLWTLLRLRSRSADVARERGAMAGVTEVGTGEGRTAPNHGNWPWRYEIDSVPVPQPVYELDHPRV
ncbi:hypothetical protein HOY80DRAFT_1078080 [Tuber brumale]|nr:hypothetical protein HOY80DRAFT_1078080 [Tuber brumale]